MQLNFASAALVQAFLPAFVCSEPRPAQLKIAFATAAQFDLGEIIPHPRDAYRVMVDESCFAVWQPGPRPVLSALDRRSCRAVVWLPTGEAPHWVRSRPALSLINAFSIDTPWTALHAGAVGRAGRFVLLAGRGRSGKTSAALACALAGWDYAGDDFVFAHTLAGEVAPLYSSARLRMDMVSAFGALLEAGAEVSEDDGERRHELRLAENLRDRVRGGSIAAIFVLRRRGARAPEFAPARRSDAFAALMAITTIGLPGWPKIVAEKIAAVADLAPVSFVDTGADAHAIPEAFAAKLDNL